MTVGMTKNTRAMSETISYKLRIHWPWWIHPAWALMLLVTTTAITSIYLPPVHYEIWSTTKFLGPDLSLKLVLGILLMFLGIIGAGHKNAKGGGAVLSLSVSQVAYLKRGYQTLFILTIIGYFAWMIIGILGGVRVDDLLAVVQRDSGAIGELKANSRPVGGVTTLTQFGPVAVVLGFLAGKLRVVRRSYWIIIFLAALRAIFYAERLAILEVLVPLLLVASITMEHRSKLRPLAQLAPLFLGPLVWLVFAASEYSRSWVFYQHVVSMPFSEWVTSRLLGYYITSYNNSALFATSYQGIHELPYMSAQGFWNAPGMSSLLTTPSLHGSHPDHWWALVLQTKSNPEFTNVGSFLVTYAEMGWIFASVFWVLIGWIIGAIFARLTRGNLMGLVAYSSLFIGLLELPRFIYWTQGRAVPVVLALIILAWMWPRPARGLADKNEPSRV